MSTSKKPAYRAVGVRHRGDQAVYVEIGAAWPTKNNGLAIRLNVLPLGDTILLFPIEDKKPSVPATAQ